MAAHHDDIAHKPGEMDITEQKKTFDGFIRASCWVAGLSILVVVFLALANS